LPGRLFTMKFACFGDTCAPPMVKPFRPHASMSRAAWSPSGLRKTLPALGWLERLGGDAAREELADARHGRGAVARGKREPRRHEPFLGIRAQAHVAVAGFVFAGLRRCRLPARSMVSTSVT
jgi:hypothetical protein